MSFIEIVIKVVPHQEQRYDTCGDWQFDGETLNIRVSNTGDWRMNFLIARHELDEAILCRVNGITGAQVDRYDLEHPESGGDSLSAYTDAPYHMQHNDALAFEWLMSRLLGVNWEEYTKKLEDTGWRPTSPVQSERSENLQ